MIVSGRYFDGKTSNCTDIKVHIDLDGVLTPEPPVFDPVKLVDVEVSGRLGNVPRTIRFADGASFETDNNDAIDRWITLYTRKSNWLHTMESRIGYVFGAILFLAVFFIVNVVWGIPWASKLIAQAVPAKTGNYIGQGALDSLDRYIFTPSQLESAYQQELEEDFYTLVPDETEGLRYTLKFRGGGLIGPNAFALPDGTVVITDEMIEIARFREEIQSVLLHEIGHVVHRHSLRMIISHSGLAVLTFALTGDVSAAGAIIVAIPNILAESSYSRGMESEADSYSLREMHKRSIPTDHFANFMTRVEHYYSAELERVAEKGTAERHDNDSAGEQDKNLLDYLSSHPATGDRIRAFDTGTSVEGRANPLYKTLDEWLATRQENSADSGNK